jgi:hypothetical protein
VTDFEMRQLLFSLVLGLLDKKISTGRCRVMQLPVVGLLLFSGGGAGDRTGWFL